MNKIIEIIKKNVSNLKGLNSCQIKKIEQFYNVQLPKEYKIFLSEMGYDAGDFMRGEDCFYDRIFELREYATDLLEEDGSDFKLEQEHYVFYSHQGYIFAFFDTSKDNSEIYYYTEGDMHPTIKYSNFESFLKDYYENMQNDGDFS
ncbi:SMI1/KNR4 family protein [uncultured Psychroserpens sp.]|uniref:SMI1/KNR4 family protein n=1 Tax=uncultured Psychroserpens sp. TaxID=255436 RepID=UPI002603C3B2|nr:SMI1/KNR4 family protein [uncultured Psychroserpens sp.]